MIQCARIDFVCAWKEEVTLLINVAYVMGDVPYIGLCTMTHGVLSVIAKIKLTDLTRVATVFTKGSSASSKLCWCVKKRTAGS